MIIDTSIFKTEKEIAELYDKLQPSVNRSIRRAIESGHIIHKIEALGSVLYDIRTLPKIITEKKPKKKKNGVQ